jgi:Tfp pilus assembly protein PilX
MRTSRATAIAGGQRGIALVTTMLVMLLMSALMVGFTTAVMSDQRYRYMDKDRVRAFYAAQSGLEKLSADLASLFFVNVAPSDAQVEALGGEDKEPDIDGVTFTTGTAAGEAYGITPIALDDDETGWDHITSGPYQGLIA